MNVSSGHNTSALTQFSRSLTELGVKAIFVDYFLLKVLVVTIYIGYINLIKF